MRFRAFHVLILCTVLLLAFVGTRLWQTLRAPRSWIPRVIELAPGVTQRAKDFRRSQVKNGRTVWELSAAEVQFSQGIHEAGVRDVTLTWYLEDGRALVLHSDFGRVRLDGADLKSVDVEGNVQFSFADYRLAIPSAFYDRAADKIVAEGPVSVSAKGLEVAGSSLEIDLGAKRLALSGDVRVVLKPSAFGKELDHAPF
ncbi:MAG: hypothetical protein KatS3mg077_0346 [Candidatus Binatia bacterium]|nr:MAG: hypothetical protein KatS3mg077_0346 [Candidatus Binatia bacterium]